MLFYLTLATGLAVSAVAESIDPSSCQEVKTITRSQTVASIAHARTITIPASTTTTYTVTSPEYTSTASVEPEVETHFVNITTGTTTAFSATESEFPWLCTKNSTTYVDSTSTIYTGTYSSSSLRCTPSISYIDIYTKTLTQTYTYSATPEETSTVYTPAISTTTLSSNKTTTTITTSIDHTSYTYGTTTSPREILCTTTLTSPTASLTKTQSAKCHPTNIYRNYRQREETSSPVFIFLNAPYKSPANDDPSSCCQLCVEDENCLAMKYALDDQGVDGTCAIYNSTSVACGERAFTVWLRDDPEEVESWQAPPFMPGCGYVAEVDEE
ncbi:hypothetical protein Q7P37_004849 [Cladosporium fusiforme]